MHKFSKLRAFTRVPVTFFENKFMYKLTQFPKCFSHKITENIINVDLNNTIYSFPTVWLRDNCQCSHCFHDASKSRIIDWSNFNVDIQPECIKDCANTNSLVIKWTDGHVSTFSKNWLEKRNFSHNNQSNHLKNVYRQERYKWTKDDFNTILHKYSYDEVIHDNNSLKCWLEALRKYGVSIITEAPMTEDSATLIANRVEFAKETHYGKKFIVKAKPGTTNVAYLSSNLQMHTDLPYYEYKPGVNLLHCLSQAAGTGGENLLADGLQVAEYMKSTMPDSYKILSTTLVDWVDIGNEDNNKFHSIYRSPVICEDLDGEITRINHSVPQRGSYFTIPIENVKPWYCAMKTFVNLVHSNAVIYKMNPGDILCFDNKRLLHGRKAYNDSEENIRYVVGVYLDWDYIFSRIRTLSGHQ